MKKIFLALAAVAALASCVKENTLVPEQTADNLVTITAVSADTKTTLDGANVLWQDNDAIKVVLTEGASYKYDIELTTSLDVDAETAEFTFTAEDDENVQKFNDIKADSELDEKGYAIYPSTSAQYLAGFQIIHELSEEQDGTVDPGMNLSSALVTTADIQAGEANAMFNNALTLLQIKVPAGVTSVSLTANYGLVGTLEFNKPDAEGKLSKKSYKLEKKTVTLSTGSELDPETVYSLLVYPGNATELTLSMTGLDANDVYEKTISKVLEPSTYYTMDLTKIFNIGVIAETTLKASSAGDEFVIPVADAAGYEYTVTESEDWITAQILETRAFSGKEIVLTIAANDGEAREAQVSIVCERETRTFTVSQEGKAELSFVYVDPEDPESGLIQWEESFGFYDLDENLLASYTNVFTISLAEGDELTYGTYKIENMLKAFFYYGEGFQEVNGQGGVYYANYDAGKKELIVSMTGATKSYDNMSDITLIYDDANKTFSAETFAATAVRLSGISSPTSGYIGGYTVTVKVDDPGMGDSPYADLFGKYTENFADGAYYGNPAKGILTIDPSDDANYHLKMTFFGGTSAAVTVYANVDGNTITTVQPAGYTNMGTFYASTLTVSGSTISGTLIFDYPTVPDYTATKQ